MPNDITSQCCSWEAGLKKPKTILLTFSTEILKWVLTCLVIYKIRLTIFCHKYAAAHAQQNDSNEIHKSCCPNFAIDGTKCKLEFIFSKKSPHFGNI